jgi:RNA polymerase sigma-70 factor (ECF subfamily)
MSMTRSQDVGPLLDRVALGDRTAFADVYQATSARLYGIVLRILKRRDLADEVLQEVYVKIWERARDFDREKGSALAWMSSIARNRALDEVRRKKPDSIEDHPEIANTVSEDASALTLVLRGEDGRRLADCLAQLGEDRRKMVVLAYCEGLSRDELAEMFRQPVNTIKTWLRRSLGQLKGCLSA